MTTHDPPSGSGGFLDPVDWKEARARMKRVIAANVQRAGEDTVDDLAQCACIGLMRAVLRGNVRTLEGLQVTIAKRVAIDWMRKLPPPDVPLPDDDSGLPAPAPDDWIPADEAEFYMRQIIELGVIGQRCCELFGYWLATLSLVKVAERLGISHADARQRDVRCKRKVRAIYLADSGPIGQWVRDAFCAEP